ncbi:hypothetical protein RBH26_21100 [Natronolimnohabitans sp. A-GB9]|uniref:hypothetical protein n=1 Tax=Natronolimnohabitans sp. A-GB9 TaxID=3069757 RepID=UPI0027B7A074|nr:hypothetical protein [Natronolimnohabitans sp. A-GB9]MDQ2052943.1 hypothetical protein [Natronolimnohabitans sp. A-GB9]
MSEDSTELLDCPEDFCIKMSQRKELVEHLQRDHGYSKDEAEKRVKEARPVEVEDGEIAERVTGRIRSVLSHLSDPNPLDHPDDRSESSSAGAVSDSPSSRMHVAAYFDRAIRAHALHEGHSLYTETDGDE